MDFFFELLKNRIGFSRIGRINLLGSQKPIKTPTLVIPFNRVLMEDFDFIDSFGNHKIFLISEKKFLNAQILDRTFKASGFVYTHHGTLKQFKRILSNNKDIILKNDVIPIIPFNIPTTSINIEFAKDEIQYHLREVETILKSHPQINFGISIQLFEYLELFELFIPLIRNYQNIRILNFLDLFDNLSFFRNILELIIKIKCELDSNLVLMASGNLISKHCPLLLYLGFDLINVAQLPYLATENFYDTVETLLPTYKIKYLPCNCLACKGELKDLLQEKYSSKKMTLLSYHNLITAKNYMDKTVQYLHTEDFRAFVEKASLNDLNFSSMLKILDRNYFDSVKLFSQLTQKSKTIESLASSSYYRPDFMFFRKNLIRNFKPEYWTRLILLLPCSAKKPYSQSRSHQMFYKAIRTFHEFPTFQEIILTSPLGAIPRQLENIYPVNCYDISVTGFWNTEEIEIAAEMLIELLKKYDAEIPIICHLEGGYREITEIAQDQLPHAFYFSKIKEHITSKDSLEKLGDLIRTHKQDFDPSHHLPKDSDLTQTWVRKLSKIVDYQYGEGFGDKLVDSDIRYKKNRFNTKMMFFNGETNEKMGSFRFATGKLRLTIEGVEKIAFEKDFSNYLIFDGNSIRGNTLFHPGIKNHPPSLLPNQNVCIFDKRKENVIAVGDMIVSSQFIKNSTSGRIVKLYETK